MVDTTKLTAWERWELASFDAPATKAAPEAPVDQEVAAATVHLPTAEEIEQIHQQAREEGFQKGRDEGFHSGYEDGLQQGLAAGRQLASAEAERLSALATRLEAALARLEAEVADELLALAVELAREVVRQEIHARPQALLQVVREALAQLPHQHAAIYLNPEDASLLRSYLGEQLSHAGHRIHEDFKLARGDCLIEAGGTQVDATVAMRWRRVLEGLGIASAWQPQEAVPPAPAAVAESGHES